jgi:hypothetical protein
VTEKPTTYFGNATSEMVVESAWLDGEIKFSIKFHAGSLFVNEGKLWLWLLRKSFNAEMVVKKRGLYYYAMFVLTGCQLRVWTVWTKGNRIFEKKKLSIDFYGRRNLLIFGALRHRSVNIKNPRWSFSLSFVDSLWKAIIFHLREKYEKEKPK